MVVQERDLHISIDVKLTEIRLDAPKSASPLTASHPAPIVWGTGI
jgi:hypothetical protein